MKKIFCLIFILTMAIQIQAQWEQCNGPYGGGITVIAVHDTSIFAVTRIGCSGGSLFLSTNSGRNWRQIGSGIEDQIIIDIAITSDGSEIFALSDSGVFYSKNNGGSWVNIGPKLSEPHLMTALAAYPNDSGGTSVLVGTLYNGIFLSNNLGKSWEQMIFSLKSEISSICVIGSRIFTCTWQGLYISTDGGRNWKHASSIYGNTGILRVIAGPDSTTLFACPGGPGILVSKDNGEKWALASSDLMDSWVRCLTLAGKNLYAGTGNGVYRSTNNGKNWQLTGLPGIDIASIAAQSSGDTSRINLFAGAFLDKGIFLSTDMGESWNEANHGITNSVIQALAVYVDNTGFPWLFAGVQRAGISRSTDNGESWAKADSGIPPNRTPLSFAFNNGKMFAGTDTGLFISYDNGSSWTGINSGLPFSSYDNKIFISSDNSGNISIFAGTLRGLYRSIDTGKSWKAVNAGLPISDENHTGAFAQMGPYIFLGFWSWGNSGYFQSYGGLFRSSDNGANWTKLLQGLPDIPEVRDIAIMGTNIFSAINGGIFLSTDNGTKWENITPASPEINGVSSLTVNNSNLLAASSTGVYLTTDYGKNWKDISQGLPAFISMCKLTSNSTHMFLGIAGYGLWRLPLSGIAADVKGLPEVPVKFSLEQNYPNPFNPTTAIKFTIPEASHVTLRIYDSMGQLVTELLSRNMNKGAFTIEWNAETCASGVYFYQIISGGFKETKKMILLR